MAFDFNSFKNSIDKLVVNINENSDAFIEHSLNLYDADKAILEFIDSLVKREGVIKSLNELNDELKGATNEVKSNKDELKNLKTETTSLADTLKDASTTKIKDFVDSITGSKDELLKLNKEFIDLHKTTKKENDQRKKQLGPKGSGGTGSGSGSDKDTDWTPKKAGLRAAITVGKELISYGKTAWGYFQGIDEEVRNVNRHLGMGGEELANYQVSLQNLANRTLTTIGMGARDFAKIQSSYIEETGRSIMLSNQSMEGLAHMGKILGSTDAGAKFAADMDKFGMSAQQSNKYMQDIVDTARKGGVSLTRATNLVQSNLNLAQTYTFKKGLDGLKNMSVYSLQTRQNMQQVAAFADKVGTLEGAIETSAKLQVLGGSFSQFSNPLEMFYNATNDFEQLGKNMNEMFTKNMFLDRNSGTFNATVADKMRMRAAANEMGIDYNEAFTAAQTTAMRKELEKIMPKSIAGETVDEDIKNLLASQAKLTKDGRGATIAVKANEQDVKDFAALGKQINEGDLIDKNISKLTKEQLNQLKIQEKPLKTIAEDVTSVKEILQGFKDLVSNILSKTLYTKAGQMIKGAGKMAADHPYLAAGTVVGGGIIFKSLSSYLGKSFDKLGKTGSWKKSFATPANKYFSGAKAVRKLPVSPGAVSGGSRALGALGKVGSKVGKFGGAVGGGLLAGGFTALSYASEGAFDKASGRQGEAVGATIGATAGAAIGATLGSFAGPLGTLIGGAIGSFAGEFIGKKIGQWRDRKKREEEGKVDSYNNTKSFMAYINSAEDELSVQKEIAKSAFAIENILKAQFNRSSAGLTRKEEEKVREKGIDVQDDMTLRFNTEKVNDKEWGSGSSKTVISNGKMYQTHPDDTLVASKPGGPLYKDPMRMLYENSIQSKPLSLNTPKIQTPNYNASSSSMQPIDVNIKGTLKLEADGRQIDLNQIVKDPAFIRSFTNLIVGSIKDKDYQGKYKSNLNQMLGYYYNK